MFCSTFSPVFPISSHKFPVANMPQQRSDQNHPPGTPNMMHPATAAGPQMVAPSPAYSAQYFTCSPQQFSQPLVQQMTHYQSQVRFLNTGSTTIPSNIECDCQNTKDLQAYLSVILFSGGCLGLIQLSADRPLIIEGLNCVQAGRDRTPVRMQRQQFLFLFNS